jgi:adenylyltransferase/sulfurtransferase
MNEITPTELAELKNSKEKFQLIDVREPSEYKDINIKGKLIPMDKIPDNLGQIRKDQKVVVMCRSGMRSGRIASYLQKQGYDNVFNLKGGIMRYARDVGI